MVVSLDTHNDLRLAVDALSGGRSDTIYAEGGRVVRRNRSRCSFRASRKRCLMDLAIKFQEIVDRGEVRDYADLARLGFVTQARLTLIMNLLLSAPDIQEEIMGLGQVTGETIAAERYVSSVVRIVL